MPLILRDTRRPAPTAFRCPDWFRGVDGMQRAQDEGGDYIGTWNPELQRPEEITKGATWHELGDDWSACLVGDFTPASFLRSKHSLPLILPVADRHGRAWHAPVVYVPHSGGPVPAEGTIALQLGWGFDPETKVPVRVPSADQAVLIAIAKAVRAEILAQRLNQIPIATIADWCGKAAETIYHLNLALLLRENLLDDVLGREMLMTLAGFPLQGRALVGGAADG